MIRLLIPLLLALVTGWLTLRLSLARTRRQLEAVARPLSDPALDRQLARLARALEVERIAVRVLPDEGVNGMADADGRIYLTRGFLSRRAEGAVTDEELASVIAHELGHVAHGHAQRRMVDVTGQHAVLTVASVLLHRLLPFVGPWIASHAGAAVLARLSRRDEFEADAWASALLIKAGIGTGPQKSLFAKLGALSAGPGGNAGGGGGAGGIGPAWLHSHPKPADRIAAIEANEARWLR